MPSYQKFEELPVWQSSAELYDRLDDLIDRAPPRLRAGFRVKLEQAALAVSTNIAAGFMRSGKEGLRFLEAAHEAASEVQSLVSIASRQPYLSAHAGEFSEIRKLAESCGRQLWGWAEAKQNPQAKGSYQRRGETEGSRGEPPERTSAPRQPAAQQPPRPRYGGGAN